MHKVRKVLLRFSYNLIYWNPFRPIKFWGVNVIFWANSPKVCVFFSSEFVDGCSRGRSDARKKQWSTGNSIFWFVTSSLVFLFTFLWRRFKRGDVNSRCFSERCINWKFNLRFNEDLSVQEVAENMCKIIKIILCMCSATSFHSCRYFVCCINPLRCTNGKLLQVVTWSWGHFNVDSW